MPEIITPEFLADIRSGLSRAQLVAKYGVSEDRLDDIMALLADIDAMSWEELIGQFYFQNDDILALSRRALYRYQVNFHLPVYERHRPDSCGRVRDLTESGVSLDGIAAEVDEVKEIVIIGDPLCEIGSVEFEAICRWVKPAELDCRHRSGFQIIRISPEDFRELQELIRFVQTQK